eukprot:scaffold11685_cov38-Prasinocladus_malaysianus.AAC.2
MSHSHTIRWSYLCISVWSIIALQAYRSMYDCCWTKLNPWQAKGLANIQTGLRKARLVGPEC